MQSTVTPMQLTVTHMHWKAKATQSTEDPHGVINSQKLNPHEVNSQQNTQGCTVERFKKQSNQQSTHAVRHWKELEKHEEQQSGVESIRALR